MPLYDVPNELLHEIALNAISSLDILLLFKQWHAVASAVLYHTITLRSMTQTRLLARSLVSNPSLVLKIKRLRFNGGYGTAAGTILRAMPHLEHLCLAMSLFAKENIDPMRTALKGVNPTRVSLYDNRPYHKNRKTAQLVQTVCQCIEGPWSKMKKFDFPYNFCCHSVQTTKYGALVASLTATPTLRVLYVLCINRLRSTLLGRVLENPSLQSVVCRRPHKLLTDSQADKDDATRLCALVKYPGNNYDDVSGEEPFITHDVKFIYCRTFKLCLD